MLFEAARLTLIKSVLSSLPVYYMSLYLMPITVAKQIDRMLRQFFWSDSVGKKKMHNVNWEGICCSKEAGGLGIKDTRLMNLALLHKWHWRFAIAKNDLWRNVIAEKYGLEDGGWTTLPPNRAGGRSLWHNIFKV